MDIIIWKRDYGGIDKLIEQMLNYELSSATDKYHVSYDTDTLIYTKVN